MTVEQLNQANDIIEKVEKLKIIKNALSQNNAVLKISWIEKLPISVYEHTISVNRAYDSGFVEVMDKYIASRIAELEKQLEEL